MEKLEILTPETEASSLSKEGNIFEIFSNEFHKFRFSFENKNDNLLIKGTCKKNSIVNNFEGIYTLKEIKNNKILCKCDSIEEIIKEIFKFDDKNIKIQENNNKIDLIFSLLEDKLIFSLNKKLSEKQIIDEQKIMIDKLENNLKELKEEFNNLKEEKEKEIKDLKLKYEEGNYLAEDNLNIKYGLYEFDKKEIICDKYMTISELKNKIKQENNLRNSNYVFFFCGLILRDNMKIKDLQMHKYTDEKIKVCEEDKVRKINIYYNNVKIEFYFYLDEFGFAFNLLQKYISIYFKIPKQNQYLYYNPWLIFGKKKLNSEICYLNIALNKKPLDVTLEFLSDLEFIKIYIIYKENKWELEVNRYSNRLDLMQYLKEKYSFIYDKDKEYPILRDRDDHARIEVLRDSNIIDGDEIFLEFIPTYDSIYSKIYDSSFHFTVFIKTLTGKSMPIDVCLDTTIFELEILIELKEGILYEEQRLVFAGKQLESNRTIRDYNIQRESYIHSVLRLRGGKS